MQSKCFLADPLPSPFLFCQCSFCPRSQSLYSYLKIYLFFILFLCALKDQTQGPYTLALSSTLLLNHYILGSGCSGPEALSKNHMCLSETSMHQGSPLLFLSCQLTVSSMEPPGITVLPLSRVGMLGHTWQCLGTI